VNDRESLEPAFGGRLSDSDRQIRRSGRSGRSAGGLRFEILRGTPEGDDIEVIGAAIDRLVAWDRDQEPSGWVTRMRPGIGLRAWAPGSRWSQSLRSSWGQEP
jgi:hypothetical protein